MSKVKDLLGQDALDARELVDDGIITEQEWLDEYQPMYVDPVEKMGDMVSADDDHDCHAEGGESGCTHPSHREDVE
jgi:hypothetical protein